MQEDLKNNYCLKDNTEENYKLSQDYNFSKFLADEDFDLDDELTGKLIPIAKKLNLSQESLDLLLELALEMSKKQIIDSFNSVLSSLESWQQYFNDSEIYRIQKNYKELESNISELELCLADYDDIFHCEGISYALYQTGHLLSEILSKRRSD